MADTLTDAEVGLEDRPLSDADVGLEMSDADVGLEHPNLLSRFGKALLHGITHPGESAIGRSEIPSTSTETAAGGGLSLGEPSPELIPRFGQPGTMARGVSETVSGLIEGAVTPEGQLMVGASAVPGLQPIVAGLASGLMAKQAGGKLGEASVTGNPQTTTEGVLSTLIAPLPAVGASLLPRTQAALKDVGQTVNMETLPGPEEAIPEPVISLVETTPAAATPAEPRLMGIPAISALQKLRRGVREMWDVQPERREVLATFDAIANEANLAGRQVENKLKLAIPDKLDREAMPAIVQAPTMAKMIEDTAKVETSDAPENLKAIYRHALDNYERLREKASVVNDVHADQLAEEHNAGIETDSIDNYIAQRWDFDTMLGENKPVILDATGGGGRSSNFFKKQRSIPDYATGIAGIPDEAGNPVHYIPKNLDVAALAAHRIRAGQMLINQRNWVESLRGVRNALDDKPLVASMITQPKGTQVPPPGYRSMNLLGHQVAVHEVFAPLVDALTAASRVPGALVKGPAYIKHGLLFFDTFHASRLMQMAAAAKGSVGYERGLSVLEYAPEDIAAAVRSGEITQEMADYANANRATLREGVANGLNVARISDALYKNVVANMPVVGGYTKWLFDKFQRGLMAETYIGWRERNGTLYPGESGKQLALRTANEVNTFYRNLGSQGLFKSKTWQDIARIIMLAPQWVEGGVRSEARAFGGTLKVPIDVARGNARVGNLTKATGNGLLAYAAVAQIINFASTGHSTWENEDPHHKLDAYVPDWISGSEGYWFSPLSVFAEMTHDFLKYDQQENSELGIVARIAGNKLNPVVRAGKDLAMGKDYFNRPLPTTMDRFKQAGYDLAPVPIPLQATYASRPGQAQQTLMSSAGFKVDKVMSEKARHGMQAALMDEQLQFLVAKARQLPIEERMRYIMNERESRIKDADKPVFDRKLREIMRRKTLLRP